MDTLNFRMSPMYLIELTRSWFWHEGRGYRKTIDILLESICDEDGVRQAIPATRQRA